MAGGGGVPGRGREEGEGIPGQGGRGRGGTWPEGVFAMQRAVCLLRSRRRTFLFFLYTNENISYVRTGAISFTLALCHDGIDETKKVRMQSLVPHCKK